MQTIFLRATISGWYPKFLKPVSEIINIDTENKKILDIGTGPGTLPALLVKENPALQITGIDIDSNMITEAKNRVSHKNVSFQLQKVNQALEFEDNQFDIVTFCSVLFLLEEKTRSFLVYEALRVLKQNGKIIILTPSGKKTMLSSFVEIWDYPFSFMNWTFIIWKTVTSGRARIWRKEKWLHHISMKNNLFYHQKLVFNDNANLEIITKSNL